MSSIDVHRGLLDVNKAALASRQQAQCSHTFISENTKDSDISLDLLQELETNFDSDQRVVDAALWFRD